MKIDEQTALKIAKYFGNGFLFLFLMAGLTITGYFYLQTTKFINSALTSEGVVIDAQGYQSKKDKTHNYTAVSFATRNGEIITFESGMGTPSPSYSKGTKVNVYYQPSNPSDAKIDDFVQLWIIPFAALCPSLLVMIMLISNIFPKIENKLLCFLGLGFIGVSIHLGFQVGSFIKTADKADGKVIEILKERGQKQDYVYRPYVEFYNGEGRSIKFSSNTASSNNNYRVGDNVRIYYQEDFPENARIDCFFDLWGLPCVLFTVGLFFVLGPERILKFILVFWMRLKSKIV